MTAPYNDLGSLDDWLLKQGIEQAERGISIEDELIPGTVERLGLPYVYLYATVIFDGEVANGGLPQFFENSPALWLLSFGMRCRQWKCSITRPS